MSTFAELYRLFQSEVMELCLNQCFAEERAVFYVDEYEEFDDKCGFCHRQRLYSNFSYCRNGNATHGPYLPNNFRDPTCGDPQCLEFSAFFDGPNGYQRRKRFRHIHKAEPEWLDPIDVRINACLAALLNAEAWAKKGKNGRLQRSA